MSYHQHARRHRTTNHSAGTHDAATHRIRPSDDEQALAAADSTHARARATPATIHAGADATRRVAVAEPRAMGSGRARPSGEGRANGVAI